MTRIKIHQTIKVYEVDDEEVPAGQEKCIGIDSHWNWNNWVILSIGKKRYTVAGQDLITAIDNAMNSS